MINACNVLHSEVRDEGIVRQEDIKESISRGVVGVGHTAGDQGRAEPVLHVRTNMEGADLGFLEEETASLFFILLKDFENASLYIDYHFA